MHLPQYSDVFQPPFFFNRKFNDEGEAPARLTAIRRDSCLCPVTEDSVSEQHRLIVWHQCPIPDTLAEPGYAIIVAAASMVCGTLAVKVSFVDTYQQSFTVCVRVTARQAARTNSACARTIGMGEPFVVNNTPQILRT